MSKYASRICTKCRAVLPIVGWDLFILNARGCLCLALVGGRPTDCMCESSQNQMAFLPPPLFIFIFVRIWPLAIFKQKIMGGLYAYNLVSCVDSLIRVGVANLAPVSKKSISFDAICSECYHSAWSVEVSSRRLTR